MRTLGPWKDKRGRLVCACHGYWFPHRKGGGACDHSKTRDIHMAIRMKDDDALEAAWIAYATVYADPNVCPF